MTKFIRTLIIINGLIIPIIVLVIFGVFLWDVWPRGGDPGGLIVGDDLDKARKDSLALQGVDVGNPYEVGNSENFYMSVSVKTYEEPRYIGSKFESSDARYTSYTHSINLIFLDKNYKVMRKLLEQNASITQLEVPAFDFKYEESRIDTTIRHITYQIAFEDSNEDGILNEEDDRDLYISNLDGSSLKKVSTGWDVEYSEFVHSGKKLLIYYTVRDKQRDEYKRSKFALYEIRSGSLTQLTDVDAMVEGIEKELNK
jgi:hypothetical protein